MAEVNKERQMILVKRCNHKELSNETQYRYQFQSMIHYEYSFLLRNFLQSIQQNLLGKCLKTSFRRKSKYFSTSKYQHYYKNIKFTLGHMRN